LLAAGGYRRLADLLRSAGYVIDISSVMRDYFQQGGGYTGEEIDTLREVFELMVLRNAARSSDLSSAHQHWLQQRWGDEARSFWDSRGNRMP